MDGWFDGGDDDDDGDDDLSCTSAVDVPLLTCVVLVMRL